MSRLKKSWKLALALLLAVVVLQISASFLVRTPRVHDRLEQQLSRAFGRAVQVRHFDVQVLPVPTLGAEAITVAEDPAFGNEYFLRADEMSAALRWLGLMRGRFELGTISLSRPSLILVRSPQGRWNLERWLPPAKRNANAYGPPAPAGPANHLRKIDFDDGRINFKLQDDKQPFAFTGVSGNVEQVTPGRWQLQLKAAPWRSGVALQSSGTLRVQGDVAGTSARLQPAQLRVRWDEASLADVLRLWRGRDFGVRGSFALDFILKSNNSAENAVLQPSSWNFELNARAAGLHRWDLGERSDNPRFNLRASGKWFSDTRAIEAATFRLDTPQSNIKGEFGFGGAPVPQFTLDAKTVSLQASDLLALFRSFHSGVDDALTVRQFFSGSFKAHGLPPRLDSAEISSFGGTVRIPRFAVPVRIGPVHLVADARALIVQPVTINSSSAKSDSPANTDAKHRPGEPATSLTLGVSQEFASGAGSIAVAGKIAELAQMLQIAQAFGHPLQHGWDLSGEAVAALRWQWKGSSFHGRWNGTLAFSNVQLQVAGLNFPVILDDARLLYVDGRREGEIRAAKAFGAHWSGLFDERQPDSPQAARWHFALSADHLDASELDRWAGPRARPNWLERLLNSMLGGSPAPAGAASDLLRSVNAEGTLRVDEVTLEKVTLRNVHAATQVQNLRLQISDADASWAGGDVRGSLSAVFLPRPSYEFAGQLDRVNLSQIPGSLSERIGGVVVGRLHLTASGVGRDELLQTLAGDGELALKNAEFRGWDLAASLADGAAHSGTSQWPAGKCSFELADHAVIVHELRLDSGKDLTSVSGRVSFGRNARLALETSVSGKRVRVAGSRILKISGSLNAPRVSIENVAARAPAD